MPCFTEKVATLAPSTALQIVSGFHKPEVESVETGVESAQTYEVTGQGCRLEDKTFVVGYKIRLQDTVVGYRMRPPSRGREGSSCGARPRGSWRGAAPALSGIAPGTP